MYDSYPMPPSSSAEINGCCLFRECIQFSDICCRPIITQVMLNGATINWPVQNCLNKLKQSKTSHDKPWDLCCQIDMKATACDYISNILYTGLWKRMENNLIFWLFYPWPLPYMSSGPILWALSVKSEWCFPPGAHNFKSTVSKPSRCSTYHWDSACSYSQ